tara:strand:- start:11 stop:139 length:129 start_codon:yes stop_codon:yes gene_type:complete
VRFVFVSVVAATATRRLFRGGELPFRLCFPSPTANRERSGRV